MDGFEDHCTKEGAYRPLRIATMVQCTWEALELSIPGLESLQMWAALRRRQPETAITVDASSYTASGAFIVCKIMIRHARLLCWSIESVMWQENKV